MDWDDFRYFSATARHASVRGAADELEVNPSTVTRRLDNLEQRLGVLLFTRSPKGLRITREGADVARRVNEIGIQLARIETQLKGHDQKLEGRIRLAVPDVLATRFVLADLAPFTEEYPAIDIELLTGYQDLNIGHGEADIVIRATDAPPELLVGRPLTRFALAAYGSKEYVANHQVLVGYQGAAWIDWASKGEVMNLYAQLRERHFSNIHVHIRCDQIQMQYTAIRAHMGLGILPCIIGDNDPKLIRLPHMPVQQGPMLWLLTHPDLRGARRIKVLTDFLRGVFEQRERELLGDLA
ncbi:MAG: LysR family transcriptional regulator [Gammaproteobacteria bacterium]|nr:LysR family transcriptional regulator [Gammaproteobacteria bacterium]